MVKMSFIGLGNMGAPMAFNLLKHGVELSVYNRSKEKAEPLIKAGAKLLMHAKDAFKAGTIVFSMLANDQALVEVTEGSEGILAGAKPGCIHVSLSTVSPETTRKLAKLHEEHQVSFISAPVFGRPEAAAKQELAICMAGHEAAKRQVEPLLLMIGKKTYDFGSKPEAANAVKAAGNFMILSAIEMMSEAFAFVEKHGVEPKAVYTLLTETLFSAPVFINYGKLILNEEFSPAGFKMNLGLKDLNIFLREADKLKTSCPFANLLKERLLESIEKGRTDLDWSAISILSKE